MSKLRILNNSEVDKGKRRYRYLTEATERSPKERSPETNTKKIKGIFSISSHK